MIRYPSLSFSNYLSLRSIIGSIPQDWITLCKSGVDKVRSDKYIVTGTGITELSEISSRKVYESLIKQKSSESIASKKWAERREMWAERREINSEQFCLHLKFHYF